MEKKIRLVTSAASGLAALFSTCAAGASDISIRWQTNANPVTVEVTGAKVIVWRDKLQTADWQKLFSVYAVQGDFKADMNVPPMLGDYRVENGVLRFVPKFPLVTGVKYRAVFRPGQLPGSSAPDLVSTFQLPTTQKTPTTVVTRIFPSADVLPENLLKFYIHFSAPMQGGNIYEHIRLLNEAGKPVELPFLEIDEELWNPDMTRLTLFIDPGRIKRGVAPLEEIGPALHAGKRYTLEIDSSWHDASGLPLRASFRKKFSVSPPDREPLSVATWKIMPPAAGSREVLTVNFPKPLDNALASRVIRVANPAGQLVDGTNALSYHEQCWIFTPRTDWITGRYELQVENTIEDLAGNNIGKAFEVDVFEPVQRRFTNAVVKVSFEVR
jgi:hypothetical protein